MAGGRERAHYRAETYRVEDSVGYLVTRLRASIFAAVDREVASWGISAAQGSILIYIAHGRGDRAADIARDWTTIVAPYAGIVGETQVEQHGATPG